MKATKNSVPRGLRNNNPGNIRHSNQSWVGMADKQTDKEFVTFRTMAYGYRALIKTLRTYRILHGCTNVKQMITRWAPPTENDTAAYIRAVCLDMQVPESYPVSENDRAALVQLAAAISHHENGIEAVIQDVEDGYELI
jgi:hypothetical protein